MHWAVPYIGLPWERGGRGAKGVDCWGLLRLVYKEQYHIELPEYPGITNVLAIAKPELVQAIQTDWDECEVPFEGAAAAMSTKGLGLHHVGIYLPLDGGKILHCLESSNVVADSFRRLKAEGYGKIRFFRHKLWPQS